jgi:flagellar P-ring protein precursor FlgI
MKKLLTEKLLIKKLFKIFFTTLFVLLCVYPLSAEIPVKIKDLAAFDGLKSNHIFGYGLVIGLQGSGDARSTVTETTLKNLMKNLGVDSQKLSVKNTAAVLITAELPPFVRVGDKINVSVSSVGDAKSLAGGTLVQTLLKGADGNTYAVAQGQLEIPSGRAKPMTIKTNAMIMGGAIVERAIAPELVTDNSVSLLLYNWDFSVADQITKEVEKKYPDSKPAVTAEGKIKINLINDISLAEMLSVIENMEVTPDYKGRIVINEKDGSIVAGGSVRVTQAMISREGLMVEIAGTDKKTTASLIEDSATISELVEALNEIGATTSDIIAILKGLKSCGALHAELIIR